MSAASVIKVIITGNDEGAKRALESTRKESENTGTSFKSMAKIGAMSFAVLAAAAVAFGVESVKAAEKDELSHKKLLTALKNTGQGWAQNSKAIEEADKRGEHFGYTAAQTEDALAQVETSTGSTSKSLKLLALAQDLAAMKGVPLNAALLAVTKASQGQLKPLKQLGVDLPIAAGGALKTKVAMENLAKAQTALKKIEEDVAAGRIKGTAAANKLAAAHQKVADDTKKLNDTSNAGSNIIGSLSKLLQGQASAAANTLHGKIAELKAKFEDWQANIGAKLIPILMALMGWVQNKLVPAFILMVSKVKDIVNWFKQHKDVAIALGIAIGTVLAGAVAVLTAGWIAETAAMIAANAPIILIVAAIALLVAGVVYAYEHFVVFRDIVQGVATAVVGYTTWLANTAVAIFNWLSTTAEHLWSQFGGRIMSIVTETFKHVISYFQGVVQVLMNVFKFFKDLFTGQWGKLWGDVLGIFGGVWKMFKAMWGLAWDGLKAVVSLVWAGVKNAIVGAILGIWHEILKLPGQLGGMFTSIGKGVVNGLIWALNKAIDLLDKFQIHIGGESFGPVTLPSFNWNGLQIPHIPTLHTGGVFNSGMGEGLALLQDGEGVFTKKQMAAMSVGEGRGGGGGNVIIHMPAGTDPTAVTRAQERYNRRNGRTG